MAKLQLKQIGLFVKVHGIRGELVLGLKDGYTFELIDKTINVGDPVFVEIDGIPVPFFIAGDGLNELNSGSLRIALDEVDEKILKKMINSGVFIETSKLGKHKGTEQFTADELIGYTISDKRIGLQGTIREFIDLKGNPMLSISVEGKYMLLPVISDFIRSIDHKKRSVIVELPEGYLETML